MQKPKQNVVDCTFRMPGEQANPTVSEVRCDFQPSLKSNTQREIKSAKKPAENGQD